MLDPKKIHEFEQGMAAMAELFPKLIAGMFKGFMDEGFLRSEALILCTAYLQALVESSGGRSNPK